MLNKLQIAIAVIITILACYGLHSCDLSYELDKQKTDLTASCNADKQITTKVDNALQNDITDINGKLTSSLMLQPSCVTPVSPASNNATGGPEHAGLHGISSQWLRQYAATAETYRAKVKACQTFLSEERK